MDGWGRKIGRAGISSYWGYCFHNGVAASPSSGWPLQNRQYLWKCIPFHKLRSGFASCADVLWACCWWYRCQPSIDSILKSHARAKEKRMTIQVCWLLDNFGQNMSNLPSYNNASNMKMVLVWLKGSLSVPLLFTVPGRFLLACLDVQPTKAY